jgi:hypothetical protein
LGPKVERRFSGGPRVEAAPDGAAMELRQVPQPSPEVVVPIPDEEDETPRRAVAGA